MTPTAIDQRRLRDGTAALAASADPAGDLDSLRQQIETVRKGIAAMQSLDDLGPTANAQAYRDTKELWRRLKKLETRQDALARKAVKS